MLRKIILLLIFISSTIFISAVNAFEPFIKSPSNPLPFSNNFQNWNELAKYQPSVLYDQGIYKMWYASATGSQYKIIYAISIDGINWIRQNLLDVYPGFDNHDPAILKTQNGYTLFFVASTNNGSQNFKIYKIDSTDGINFSSGTRQLVLQPANSLESSAVSSPSVLFENGSYYLFYLCWGNQGFRICLATSTDGSQWQRCQNNPITSEISDGPNVFKKDGKYYLFFESPLGLRQAESLDNLSCNMNWGNYQNPLPDPMIGPTVLENNNQLLLYYSGFSASGLHIHLATSQFQSQANPLIIIPGLFASWNKNAILHNQQIGIHAWKLNPIVKEYNGLITTLTNLGYQENNDFYLFYYDWRKKIEDITKDLDIFIQQDVLADHPNAMIHLAGHSLGGLTSRIYGQKFGIDNIAKIITIGSPHQGVAQVYKAVEAGDFDRNEPFQWLAQKLILQLNKTKIQSDKSILNEKFPVLLDLFPTYNFLSDQNGVEIDIQNMQIKNNLLLSSNQTFPAIFSQLQTIVGEKGKTTSGYQVRPRTTLDFLLDYYPDGRPTGTKNEIGDYTVIAKSAKADTDFISLTLDHKELVYKNQGIKSILNSLEIPHQDNQIVEGQKTKIFPSLIFLIFSPAKMEVDFNDQIFLEEDGIVFIENAQAGNYLLKILGQDHGFYNVMIGQIGQTSDVWSNIAGNIKQIPPTDQIDSYVITFNPQNLLDFPVNQDNPASLFDLLRLKLGKINQLLNNRNINQALDYLLKSKQNYLSGKGNELRRNLISVHRNLFQSLSQIPKEELFDSVSQLENLYERSLQGVRPKPLFYLLTKELKVLKIGIIVKEKLLILKKNQGKKIIEETNLLLLAKEKLEKAESALNQQNLDLAEILLLSVKELLK